MTARTSSIPGPFARPTTGSAATGGRSRLRLWPGAASRRRRSWASPLHALRRQLHYAREGKVTGASPEQQHEQAWCLTVVTNAVVCWHTLIGLSAPALEAAGLLPAQFPCDVAGNLPCHQAPSRRTSRPRSCRSPSACRARSPTSSAPQTWSPPSGPRWAKG
ncbi:Tn3 family transposase [Streptomyces longwoodensis]|uniref:Tn3 family transposase n=1 Tax=Streptomyces longwoodensis TaxID=68231 RepID=UPI0033E33B6C